MSKNFVLFCTIENIEGASQIAEDLIENRLAACVNIIPDVTSVYKWKGNLEKSTEQLMLIKTTKERLQETLERIKNLHPYEVPEIIALPIEGGHPPYLSWLSSQVQGD